MKGDSSVIDFLNQILTNELTAINQYFLHARMLSNWGFARLALKEKEESIDEMRHADQLIERILFLEGLPNLQKLNSLRIGENAQEILKGDLALELESLPVLKAAIKCAEEKEDFVSRNLFRQILNGEEEHVDFLETQLELIERVGLQNYLQSQI